MAKTRPGVLEGLARSLERACDARGVEARGSAIPHGRKYVLAQGAATGIVSLYGSGKVVANPAAERDFTDVLSDLRGSGWSAAARDGHDAIEHPYAGSDESGKGDYFGPLAVAAVLVRDAREDDLLRELGVRDSKLVQGTREPREIAKRVREVCEERIAEVVLAPERYNERVAGLRAEGKNLNALLAWAHATCLDGLLAKERFAVAVADKFGAEALVAGEMRRLGRRLALRQETRGERYTAVAAASLVARDACLAWFERAEAETGERLPRGAFDPRIVVVARSLHARGGEALLARYAKLHFRTTERVVGARSAEGRS